MHAPSKLAALLVIAPFLALASTSVAEPGKSKGHGKGPPTAKGQGHGAAEGKSGKGAHENASFGGGQRDAVLDYYRGQYASTGGCPPGLAKKNNGCTPPGQAKKHSPGDRLSSDAISALPPDLLHLLGPPPPGYGYGYIDGEIVFYDVGAYVVIDVITVVF